MKQGIRDPLWTRESGDPSSPEILLYVHGLGESGLCFENIAKHPELAHCYHLIPDLPGYGSSKIVHRKYSLVPHSEILADWLSELGLSGVIVVGHSMGGVIGQYLCEKRPDLVRAFINVDGNISLEDCTISKQITSWDLLDFLLRGYFELRRELEDRSGDDEALRSYHKSFMRADSVNLWTHSLELMQASKKEDLAQRLADLSMPRYFIAGVPGGAGRRSLELLEEAGMEWIGIEPSGHWPFLDQPDLFANQIRSILESLPAP